MNHFIYPLKYLALHCYLETLQIIEINNQSKVNVVKNPN